MLHYVQHDKVIVETRYFASFFYTLGVMNIDLSEANYAEILGTLTGLYCLVYGNGLRSKYQKLLERGVRVEGEVIEIKAKTGWTANNRFMPTYYPIVRFVTDNGPIAEKYDVFSANPSIYKQWEVVSVIYDPLDNKNFILENTSSKVAGPLLMLIGFGAIITALVFYILDPASIIRF